MTVAPPSPSRIGIASVNRLREDALLRYVTLAVLSALIASLVIGLTG
jgi:hypothetical protein